MMKETMDEGRPSRQGVTGTMDDKEQDGRGKTIPLRIAE